MINIKNALIWQVSRQLGITVCNSIDYHKTLSWWVRKMWRRKRKQTWRSNWLQQENDCKRKRWRSEDRGRRRRRSTVVRKLDEDAAESIIAGTDEQARGGCNSVGNHHRLYCTALYCTVLSQTVRYYTILSCTELHLTWYDIDWILSNIYIICINVYHRWITKRKRLGKT